MTLYNSSRFLILCLLFVAISSCSKNSSLGDYFNDPVDLLTDLKAHYKFTGNFQDESGNGHHGKAHSIFPTVDRFDNNNQAIHLTGGNGSFFEIPHHDDLNLNGNFTFCFWIKVDKIPEYAVVLGKGQDITNFYGFIINCEAQMFLLAQSRSVKLRCSTDSDFSLNKWHFIACVKNRDTKKQTLIIDNDVTINVSCRCDFSTTNKYPLIIGRHYVKIDGSGGYEYPFRGSFDDLRIYNRALTSSELKALFEEGQ